MKRLVCVVSVASVLIAGCGDPFSNELLASDVEFLLAAPDPEVVRVMVPQLERSGQPGSATMALTGEDPCPTPRQLGDTALWYCFTDSFTGEVNGGVLGFLELIDLIVHYPPTKREENKRIWGPWPGNAEEGNAHLDHRIVMERRIVGTVDDPTTMKRIFDFSMELRRNDVPGSQWARVLYGTSEPLQGTRYGVGEVHFDVDAVKQIDPSEKGQGTLDVSYDTRPDTEQTCNEQVHLDITFDNFRGGDTESQDDEPMNATYNYDMRDDCSGEFYFVASSNIDGAKPGLGADETLEIVIRWNTAGEGRGDVRVSGGDLEDQMFDEIRSSECWDNEFKRSYYTDTWPAGYEIWGSEQGEESVCEFPAWEFAE